MRRHCHHVPVVVVSRLVSGRIVRHVHNTMHVLCVTRREGAENARHTRLDTHFQNRPVAQNHAVQLYARCAAVDGGREHAR